MAITLDADKGITYPSWATAGRPAAPTAGQMGYNTTLGVIEVYNGTVWTTMVGGPWTTAGRPAAPATGQVGYNTTYGGLEVYNGTAWSTISGGPAFSAYRTATQSATGGVHTKVQYNLEDFDTNNNFDSSTNYRFTPTVAGYYQINWTVIIGNNPAGEYFSELYKNGSLWVWGNNNVTSNGNYNASVGSALVYMNGTTDYLEVYMYCASSVTISPSTAFPSRFSGCLIRGA